MQTTTKKPASTKALDMTKNIIQLRNGFISLPNAGKNNRALAMTVVSELMQFAYLPTAEAIEVLSAASEKDIIKFHDETIGYLKEFTGSGKNFRPFHKNFPEDVISMSNAEMWAHQILNYWTNGGYEPQEWMEERKTAFEHPNYTKLDAGSEEKFEAIFTNLVSVNQSLTPDDMAIVNFFVKEGHTLLFPDQIPFKENLCTLAGLGIEVPVKTTVDILRIAVHMSGGDISLPKVPRMITTIGNWRYSNAEKRAAFKFKKFSRSERKRILGLLERTNCDATEAVLKEQRWIRLGEILHPGEYKNKFPKSFKMFQAIREGGVQSWYGKVNAAFKKSFENGLRVLSERPGEFMRRIDFLVRTNDADQLPMVLATLKAISGKVSNKVLYEAYTHFENRVAEGKERTVMIKGARKKTSLPILKALPSKLISTIQKTIVKALMEKFSSLEPLGKVCIDEELKKIPLPTNMRSLNSALKPVIRGSRLPWDNQNAKVIRTFLHFEKSSTSVTIDLSVIMIGKNNAVSDYRHHKVGKDIAVHSGDSFSRNGACAEYVDIDVEKALAAGYRYALVQLHNYNRSAALNENNHFGVMERNFPNANKIWLPATIANCSIVRVENIVNCAIIDLSTGEYIMVDEDATNGGWVNMANTMDFAAVEEYIKLPKLSVYDLLEWHVEARGGKLVDGDDTADKYFTFEEFATSYIEILKYMGI
ncbi:MAG: hypothetical protein ABI207_05825 [Crocinitomicaceae bacterium]